MMRLKAQREDVKIIKNMDIVGDEEAGQIAARYQHLILLAEEADKLYYQGIYTDKARKVIEDAEGK